MCIIMCSLCILSIVVFASLYFTGHSNKHAAAYELSDLLSGHINEFKNIRYESRDTGGESVLFEFRGNEYEISSLTPIYSFFVDGQYIASGLHFRSIFGHVKFLAQSSKAVSCKNSIMSIIRKIENSDRIRSRIA